MRVGLRSDSFVSFRLVPFYHNNPSGSTGMVTRALTGLPVAALIAAGRLETGRTRYMCGKRQSWWQKLIRPRSSREEKA
jgi:hypothetical protein